MEIFPPRDRVSRGHTPLASLAYDHPLRLPFSISRSKSAPPTSHPRPCKMSVVLPAACLQAYTSIWAEIQGTKNYYIEQETLNISIISGDEEEDIKAELETEFEELCRRAYEELCEQPGSEYMTEGLKTAWFEKWVWENMGMLFFPFCSPPFPSSIYGACSASKVKLQS